jgi:2-C-methyl-D-erythritol 4-phosphate cytidylyltransferase
MTIDPLLQPSLAAPHAPTSSPGRLWALVPCAGMGLRAVAAPPAAPAGSTVSAFGALAGAAGEPAPPPLPKQYHLVAGHPMVMHTLAAFAGVARLAGTLVAVAPGDHFLDAHAHPSFFVAHCGGPTRAATVQGGIKTLLERGAQRDDWVLVHDAARCLVTPAQVDALIDACWNDAVGGLLALPLPDTLKAATDGRVAATVDRADKWLAQTPQMFRLGALRDALAATAARGFAGVTDEASAMEMAGHRPLLVRGSAQNLKITYPEDFALAEALLRSRP